MIRFIFRGLIALGLALPFSDPLLAEFRVTHFMGTGELPIDDISSAVALVRGETLAETFSECAAVINYWDGFSEGHFPDSAAFPSGFGIHFAILATAVINVPSDGTYTFGANSDDGFRLLIDGQVVVNDDSRHALADHLGTVFLEAQPHELALLFFQSGGGAGIELFAAEGVRSEFGGDFRLVGDSGQGGLSTTQVDPGECQSRLGLEISPREREALIAVYQATSGDGWKNNTGWRDPPTLPDGFNENPCHPPFWFGVTCGLNTITALMLPENGLSGPIPADLASLANLTALDFDNNQLVGPIPPELGILSALVSLRLSNNRLSGPLPAELGNLSSLYACWLWNNQLEGPIPPELGNLANLGSLILLSNRLSGSIPPELGNLANLVELYVGGNSLTGRLPVELSRLYNLRYLSVTGNQLSGPIPAELGNLNKLNSLFLSGNEFTGPIPPELGQLQDLTDLYLTDNDLTGGIPDTLGQLTRLEQLVLSFNHLGGAIPESLGGLSSLTTLLLHANELSGSIPAQLGQLSKLATLNLRHNWLQGEIPAELALPPDLRILSLSGNQLSGEVPVELAALKERSLDLRHNRLQSVQADGSPQLDLAQAGSIDWRVSQRVVTVYAQLAIGGGFQAVVNISNLERTPWKGRAYLSGGRWPEEATWTLDGDNRTGRPDFEIELAPLATRRYVIGGGINAVAGWLLIRAEDGFSPSNVAVSFFYNLSADEGLLDSTGVDGSRLAATFLFPVERSFPRVDTGVAVRGVVSEVHFLFRDQAGQRFGGEVVKSGDSASLLADLLPGLPENFVGQLEVFSPDFPIYVTVLRIESDQKGAIQLTSVPPISSEGRRQRQ